MFDDVSCNNSFMCWECDKDCHMKEIFMMPDPLFYSLINDSTKSATGLLIASGVPFETADEERKKMALTLITSRMKFLGQI